MNLFEAIDAGTLLAVVDGTAYTLVRAVFTTPPDDGLPSFYCAAEVWPTSHAARLAERDAEIASLKRRIVELERPTLTLGLPEPPAPVVQTDPDSGHPCELCPGRSFPSEKSLATHRMRKHSGRVWSTRPNAPAVPQPEPLPAPAARQITLVSDDPTWECANCHKSPSRDGAFSRSITRPDLCFRCAAQATSTRSAAQVAA